MTAQEQKTVQAISTTQAVMKEHQRNMQNDIDELKKTTKEINEKLDSITSSIDSITAGRKVLIWLASFATAVSALIIGFLNANKQ